MALTAPIPMAPQAVGVGYPHAPFLVRHAAPLISYNEAVPYALPAVYGVQQVQVVSARGGGHQSGTPAPAYGRF